MSNYSKKDSSKNSKTLKRKPIRYRPCYYPKCTNEELKRYIIECDLLNQAYHENKRILYEDENNITYHCMNVIDNSIKTVRKIESVIDNMPEDYGFIMRKEILENQMGTKWYLGYFSAPTYYRHRREAYKMFRILIEK